ncbi:Putative LOC101743068, partial [Caligus rogercresseyi]
LRPLQMRIQEDIKGPVVGGEKFTSLFFADDAYFILGEEIVDQYQRLMRIVDAFGKYSGLEINFDKSQVISNSGDLRSR